MSDQKQADRPNDSIVEIRSVSKAFAARRVLKNIDLDIGRSQSVCLSGVNGAGKSTLMRIVAGLLHPDAGSVEVGETDLSANEFGKAVKVCGPGEFSVTSKSHVPAVT